MTKNQFNRKNKNWDSIIILLSIIGLITCIAVLLPQVREMIINRAAQIIQREPSSDMFKVWIKSFLNYAMGGICFILFFDYCVLTDSGRTLVQKVKKEIKDCLSTIDFRSFVKPFLWMFVLYFLGILTIVRSNSLYQDDIFRSTTGSRGWYSWSRYLSEISSVFVHGNTNLTDISPLSQLLAIVILSVSSVFLVYIISNKKITVVGLLASVPLGLSPYFLQCLSYKFDAPYMALSILASIFPFLFIARRKAFFICSVLSLLIMCMTYQASSGIYLIIALVLCFQDWNTRKKKDKEIFSFLGLAVFSFCFTLLLFKLFLMRPAIESEFDYTATAMYPFPHIISGALSNIKNYAIVIYHDWSMIWKIGVACVLLFFITQSTHRSTQKRIWSFFVSILVIGLSFILSYGIYSLLVKPLYEPRSMLGFGGLVAVLCIYVVLDYKKPAIVAVLALNWCLFVFAFSYGNALADQARYADFRIGILLHDLSALHQNLKGEDQSIQFYNSIDYTPSIENIAKHNPVIKKLVLKRLGDFIADDYYCLEHFNYTQYNINYRVVVKQNYLDYSTFNLPVVLDSYYHTIQSDGKYILVTLKH